MTKKGLFLIFIALSFFTNCNYENITYVTEPEEENYQHEDINTETEIQAENEADVETYILVEITNGDAYIINKDGEEVYNFDLIYNLGNDANLLNDGSLVASVKAVSPHITIGGYGGGFIKQNADKTIDWQFEYSSEDYISHHDVEYLSNGNILFLVWRKVENSAAQNIGFDGSVDIFPDAIVEMNPITQEIVWEWDMMDHIIQDHDNSIENFGVIADNPNKIDINFNKHRSDGDITHANGLVLDESSDLIYVTVNFYNEVWVIDHSTTSAEAATNSGGNYGLGGDLVYRFGNPVAYKNTDREVFFDRIHAPNLLDSGNFLLFANQQTEQQSKIFEIKLPEILSLQESSYQEPEVIWEFTDENLYSDIMSNAERMKNGNTLINEGRQGTLWEVTPEGNVIWQFETDPPGQLIWRAYVFYANDPAIEALGITDDVTLSIK